tara:strand:- start:1111 stop:1422 length:312 start_codon:yes stop_codon:yes gene_type:complete
MRANGNTTASTGIWRIGYGLSQPQYKQPPSQLPETPSNNETTINHLLESFLDKTKAANNIPKVKQRALIGSNLTQGACKKIGKTTKKEDQILKDIGFDKKVLL